MFGKKYRYEVAGRKFLVGKDYFGNWSIYSAYDDFTVAAGVPPFSVGHRTKNDAVAFLKSFEDCE